MCKQALGFYGIAPDKIWLRAAQRDKVLLGQVQGSRVFSEACIVGLVGWRSVWRPGEGRGRGFSKVQ